MKMFKKELDYTPELVTTDGTVISGQIELDSNKKILTFLKNYTMHLDSLLHQSNITEQDYQNELRLVSNELDTIERSMNESDTD